MGWIFANFYIWRLELDPFRRIYDVHCARRIFMSYSAQARLSIISIRPHTSCSARRKTPSILPFPGGGHTIHLFSSGNPFGIIIIIIIIVVFEEWGFTFLFYRKVRRLDITLCDYICSTEEGKWTNSSWQDCTLIRKDISIYQWMEDGRKNWGAEENREN